MSLTAFIYHADYLKHKPYGMHPESPARLHVIREAIEQSPLRESLILIPPRPASVDEIASIHSRAYIAYVERSCRAGRTMLDDWDTYLCAESYEVARLAVGGVLTAIEVVLSGQAPNAFCAVRPPGHHAEQDFAKGFCLFNNVAIGARYVQRKLGLRKVLIVDWDLHHGNGTQHAFYDDASVLYFSIHLWPYYPGTGRASEIGTGAGEGYTINGPLGWGSGDEEALNAFRKKLIPAVRSFAPEFVLISAGFDGHMDDPLSALTITEDGFEEMTRIVKGIAEEHCKGRLVSVLEGGYHPTALPRCVERHLSVLTEGGG